MLATHAIVEIVVGGNHKTPDDTDAGDQVSRGCLPGAAAGGWAPLKNSVGLITCVHRRKVALPLLGLDFGYGVERRASEIYLAIGLVE